MYATMIYVILPVVILLILHNLFASGQQSLNVWHKLSQ